MTHWRENSNLMRGVMREYERDLDDIIKADRRLRWGVYVAVALLVMIGIGLWKAWQL